MTAKLWQQHLTRKKATAVFPPRSFIISRCFNPWCRRGQDWKGLADWTRGLPLLHGTHGTHGPCVLFAFVCDLSEACGSTAYSTHSKIFNKHIFNRFLMLCLLDEKPTRRCPHNFLRPIAVAFLPVEHVTPGSSKEECIICFETLESRH